jgi:lysozyme
MRKFVFAVVVLAAGCASVAQPVDKPLTPGIFLDEERNAELPNKALLRPVPESGLAMTMEHEGWRPKLYNDAANYCTIGYGHLIKHAPCDNTVPADWRKELTLSRGKDLLVNDMAAVQHAVMTLVKTSLNDAQYAALCDFVYNVGPTNFRESKLLKVLNASRFDEVPAQLRRWTRAGSLHLASLANRREHEVTLFMEGRPMPHVGPKTEEDLHHLDIRTGR